MTGRCRKGCGEGGRRSVRDVALTDNLSSFNTLAGSHAAARAMKAAREGKLGVRGLQG